MSARHIAKRVDIQIAYEGVSAVKRKVQGMASVVLLSLAGAAVFLYTPAAVTGVSRGLSLCGTVIIPSLLPFMVLVGTFMRLRLSDAVGRLLARPTRWLFRLPGCCALPILLSMVGGYPAGAVAIEQLLSRRQITESQAAQMLHFCVNAGPAFAVSAVGAVLLGDVRIGWLLYAAHVLAALLIGVVQARFLPPPAPTSSSAHRSALPLGSAFAAAVNSAALSLLYMCGFVLLFAVVLSISDAARVSTAFQTLTGVPALFSGLLEVGSGCVQLAGEDTPSMFLLGFFLGFGGLSVQCQVRALLQAYPAALRRFCLFRVLHGLLGGLLTAVLYHSVPLPLQTLASGTARLEWFTATPAVSLAMLAMCVTVMLGSEKKIAKRR